MITHSIHEVLTHLEYDRCSSKTTAAQSERRAMLQPHQELVLPRLDALKQLSIVVSIEGGEATPVETSLKCQ